MSDIVRHPEHYTSGGIETIDYIKAKLGDGFVPYCLGNVLKYVSRAGKKDPTKTEEDLEKARVYLTWAINAMREGTDYVETD